jgi:gluconate 2-dehydrogenase gamma chain
LRPANVQVLFRWDEPPPSRCQACPEEPIRGGQLRPLEGTLENVELLPKSKHLHLKGSTAAKAIPAPPPKSPISKLGEETEGAQLLKYQLDRIYENDSSTVKVVYSANWLLMTRRELLRQSALHATAVWALLSQTHSHEGASAEPGRLRFFTPEQASSVEAVAAQIIPADDTPGAREAGVIRFIDLNLATYETEMQPAYIAGLKMLAEKSRGRFADLDSASQIEVLRAIETSEFFDLIRRHTVMGFLSHPQYGGNRGKIGWKLIGFDDDHVFRPPFGYYDGPEGEKQQ